MARTFNPGDRVRRINSDNTPFVPIGSLGTIAMFQRMVEDYNVYVVNWDNGAVGFCQENLHINLELVSTKNA